MLAKKYLSLAPVHPPKYWIAPGPLERAKMEYEIEMSGRFFHWFPHLNLQGKDVFEIGSGYGGSAVRFSELGARRVIGLEPFVRPCKEAKNFSSTMTAKNVSFVVGTGEQLPLQSDLFDVITSFDVFEHVEDLERVLDECVRVLKPGGTLYAVFPPFYHPTGAHLDTWISKMPWANVFFRCDTVIRAVNEILTVRNDRFQPNAMRPKDRLWALNGSTIRSVERLLNRKNYARAHLALFPLFSPANGNWNRWRMKYYAFAFKPLPYIPLLRELFVHRMVLTITK